MPNPAALQRTIGRKVKKVECLYSSSEPAKSTIYFTDGSSLVISERFSLGQDGVWSMKVEFMDPQDAQP